MINFGKIIKLSSLKYIFTFFPLVSFLNLMWTPGVFCEDLEPYKKCFSPLPGWEADKIEGMSMNFGGLDMVTATRIYAQKGRQIQVSFILGGIAEAQKDLDINGKFQMETKESSIKVKKINGKTVTIVNDKVANESTVSIALKPKKKEPSGAILSFLGTNMNADELLELAQKFDWSCFEKQINAQK